MDLMGSLEMFLHLQSPELPALVKAALAHVQFETIHPFLDGNGRVGRLLITLLLCVEGAIREPILYLSLYLKTHRQRYYELLDRVRSAGDWEAWLEFFLDGIRTTADQAADTARRILAICDEDHKQIETLGRPAAFVLRVHQLMRRKPMVAIPTAAQELGVSPPTTAKAIQHLVDLGIVREMTGRQRHRLFVYSRYMAALSQDEKGS
jgi:Fic family protein